MDRTLSRRLGVLRELGDWRACRLRAPSRPGDLDLALQLSDGVWLLDGAGGFSVGTPDALSRSGAVGCAFDTDAIRFSPSHGRFEIRTSR